MPVGDETLDLVLSRRAIKRIATHFGKRFLLYDAQSLKRCKD
jgi:hypothetical protein